MNNSFVDYITDLLSTFGTIKVKAMFGGYGIYCNNFIFAIIVDNELYFKTDKLLSKEFESQDSHPFTYKARGKTIALNYYRVPIEIIEDEERFRMFFDKSYTIAKSKK
jgi:DNA transformation protein